MSEKKKATHQLLDAEKKMLFEGSIDECAAHRDKFKLSPEIYKIIPVYVDEESEVVKSQIGFPKIPNEVPKVDGLIEVEVLTQSEIKQLKVICKTLPEFMENFINFLYDYQIAKEKTLATVSEAENIRDERDMRAAEAEESKNASDSIEKGVVDEGISGNEAINNLDRE